MRVRTLVFVVVVLLLIPSAAFGADGSRPRNLISFNPLGPLIGLYSGSFEHALDDEVSVAVSPTYYNWNFGLLGLLTDDDWTFWYFSVDGGANYYFDRTLEGIYAGGVAVLGYGTVGYRTEKVNTLVLGAQGHAGYRWIFDWVAVAPQIGMRYEVVTADYEGELGAVPPTSVGGFSFPIAIQVALAF